MSLFLGRATLAPPTLILLALAGVLAALGGNPGATTAQRFIWLGVGLISQAALTAVYLFASALPKIRQSRIGVLTTIVLAAAARALVLATVIPATGGGDPLTPAERVLTGTVTFSAWGVILGAVVQSWTDYRSALRALLERVDRTLAEAEEFTREWSARLSSTEMTARELERTASQLHYDIEHRLRPMSHRLWFGVSTRLTRTRFLKAVLLEPLPIVWIAIPMLVLYIWNTSPHFGVMVSATVAGITTGGIVVVLIIGQYLEARLPQVAISIRIASVFLSAVVAVAVDWWSSGSSDRPGITVVAIGLVTIIIGIQIIAVSTRQRRRTLQFLADRVDALDNRRNEIAADLHSRMQSKWTATALRLQEAAETGDIRAAQRALAEARALVDRNSSEPHADVDVVNIAQAWEGIASVKVEMPPSVPSSMRTTLSNLIAEAIANAVRHGRARCIDVLVTVNEQAVEVVVTDDGVGVTEAPRAGLGSLWLDGVAEWKIHSLSTGARLTASLPIAP